jgi:hypothetical protein
MLFVAFQEVVAGILDDGRERREPNFVKSFKIAATLFF